MRVDTIEQGCRGEASAGSEGKARPQAWQESILDTIKKKGAKSGQSSGNQGMPQATKSQEITGLRVPLGYGCCWERRADSPVWMGEGTTGQFR